MTFNYCNKESIIFIRMESLFLSFIEDNFFNYIINKYGLMEGLKQILMYSIDFKKFQQNIIKEINHGDFLNYLYLNHNLLNYLRHQKSFYQLVLISDYSNELVDIIVSYFNLSKGFGNIKNNIINQWKYISHLYYSVENKIFVTDEIDLDFSLKNKKIISCGSLMKTFINCLIHKDVYIIKSTNSYNGWLYKMLIEIKTKKKSRKFYGLLIIMIPLTELWILSQLFFHKILIFMTFLFLLSITFFPKIFLLKYSFLILMETNNFFNIYNIILSFNDDGHGWNKNLMAHGVMKSFGSLSVGLFLFCFVNFLYFNNKFSLLIQIFYIGVLLKYSKFLLEIKNHKFFFYFFNILAGYFSV